MNDEHQGTAALIGQTVRSALMLADRMCLQLVQQLPVERTGEGTAWRSVRPLLSQHEHASASIDMHLQVMQYLFLRGLVAHHPQDWHLVRMTGQPGGA